MPVSSGPDLLGESNLVFAYDTGDVSNSYKGQPTTNLINPDNPNIYSWWGRNVQTITQLTEKYKGQPIYRVSISIDNGDMLYHIKERWGAGSGWYMPHVVFNANTPYIASVIYRPVSHPDTRIYGHPSNIGGWGLSVDGSIDIDNQWKMHRIDRNHGATVGDNRFYHMHTPSATLGQTIVVDITNSQIEQKSNVTPFVNGTRSSTQGLLPVIGNSTIDLTNVSFDSNAQMVFDGTNDIIILSQNSNFYTSNWSWELITKFTGNTGTYQGLVWAEGDTGGGSGLQYLLSLYSNSYFHYRINNTSTGWANTDTSTINFNPLNFNHIVWQFENGTTRIYINGSLFHTNSSRGSYSGGSNSPMYIGGRNDSAYVSPMMAPIYKFYNRPLTAQEVRQNYQQYKTRFNLS